MQPYMPGSIIGATNPAGYLISHHINNSFVLVNRLLKNKAEVYWLQTELTADGQDLGTGTIWVPASSAALPVLQKGSKELGIMVHAVAKAPTGQAFKIQPVRIGLYDQYGGRISEDKTLPEIKKFVDLGGAVITVGSSTSMAELLGVPMTNHLADASGKALPRDKFYIPGSLMRTTIDNTNPLAYGMPKTVETFFDNSPVFNFGPGVKSVASFQGKETLDSGWAWGQDLLDGGSAVAEAKVGEGKVLVMGPEVTFRGEPHATFKLMFNGVLYGNAQSTTLK
jgi:hypothetical protein